MDQIEKLIIELALMNTVWWSQAYGFSRVNNYNYPVYVH